VDGGNAMLLSCRWHKERRR